MFDILIVGDSRLRNLDSFLENISPTLRFSVRVLSGAGIEEIGLYTRVFLSYQVRVGSILVMPSWKDGPTKLLNLVTIFCGTLSIIW